MKKLTSIATFLTVVLILTLRGAQSATISLDAMNTNSYTTPYGTITFSGGLIDTSGGYFMHDGAYMTSAYAQFNFDFDVDAISFTAHSMNGGIHAVVYDTNNNEVDSYLTLDYIMYHPVSLSGAGIRQFDFADGRVTTIGGGGWADIENVVITTSAPVAPEPISSILFVTGGALLAGKKFIRRNERGNRLRFLPKH